MCESVRACVCVINVNVLNYDAIMSSSIIMNKNDGNIIDQNVVD